MIHPNTALAQIDERVGVGVVATQPIAAGTLVWVRDSLDAVVAQRDVDRMPKRQRNAFRKHAYQHVDGEWLLLWDISRFVNHHCDPNTVTVGTGMEIACRDIAVGEQITNDYAFFLLEPDEEFPCACGDVWCRGIVDSRDLDRFEAANERRVDAALGQFRSADVQPLWDLLTNEQIRFLFAASATRSPATRRESTGQSKQLVRA